MPARLCEHMYSSAASARVLSWKELPSYMADQLLLAAVMTPGDLDYRIADMASHDKLMHHTTSHNTSMHNTASHGEWQNHTNQYSTPVYAVVTASYDNRHIVRTIPAE